ncbi:hypothetical protein chiPu_0029571, partial [Chiloscyllium punctatum]|nr:hypothetical protein [Chiloscyllium punctatum]
MVRVLAVQVLDGTGVRGYKCWMVRVLDGTGVGWYGCWRVRVLAGTGVGGYGCWRVRVLAVRVLDGMVLTVSGFSGAGVGG